MSNLHQLLKDYQQLQALSRKILALASGGQWDELVAQEIVYIQLVENLTKRPIPTDVDSVMQLHFRRILREIIENESQIKELLRKRMDDLSLLMKNSVAQQNVNSTYGEFSQHRLLPGDLSNQ
ncbi:flagella biosynthesis regulatory protein FliT [Pectobacterium sp. FL60-S17]|uniref:flagella biosynthesis regulatory protein FliT n=1 Tax=Pectobacterium TaxID=122277 RepID=UPI00057DB4CE|nr:MULTISPECIES: flagella biosynthesis regulatory protein FliT [Pectobacterium]PLY36627.1 flagella biosynthesis regulatory protein FliT [Pectobacterium carotovorum]KHS84575.1 flagellar biosynthesis protein FliT [Pectobacterium carotovorum subsp. carotovorum]KHT35003.1 flagellar biosynthesis protein FliT [Pectobacterium carotovorum subsp. carotovorum]MBE5203814.1 flagella biosynthesis regulatory protein FliT [Pectobacterium quasiaquaticum]MBE5211274.1 flagella biosynthesis regulatory protein Fl